MTTTDDTRARFHRLTAEAFAEPLPGGCVVRVVAEDEWKSIHDRLVAEAFDRSRVDNRAIHDDATRTRFESLDAALAAAPLTHRLAFEVDGALAGGYLGFQEQYARYYMCLSGVLEPYRRRGIYRAFLDRLLELLEAIGFREVYSRHQAHNNAILVPKLQAGFLLSSFEVSLNHGLVVHLRYPFNDSIRNLYAYRIDAARNSAALRAAGILDDDLVAG